MKKVKSVLVVATAMLIALGVMYGVKPSNRLVKLSLKPGETKIVASPIAFETTSAEAVGPCGYYTITVGALSGAVATLNGANLPEGQEVAYKEGDLYVTWTTNGKCVNELNGTWSVANLQAYAWQQPNGPWYLSSSKRMALPTGCEIMYAILHTYNDNNCSNASCGYTITNSSCPCQSQ